NGPATQLGSFPSAWIHKTYISKVSSNPYNYKDLQKYLCQLKKALEEYQSNIPDPKEWSQDYPWFSSNVIQSTPA
ncbi:hypothetical protein Godav_002646, partial [Gossypium davidsonii]|nr:hypothetical protein [Gossypium davidsonii]